MTVFIGKDLHQNASGDGILSPKVRQGYFTGINGVRDGSFLMKTSPEDSPVKTLLPCLCSCAVVFLMYGCGPMQMPMPVRLDADAQNKIDQTWDKALAPVARFDHQGLLDFFLVTQAYQAGVDRLSFRSEKKVALGMVVMEIEYDRLKPDQDRFEVKLYDPAGMPLRQDRYSREEVEGSYRDLFARTDDLERKIDQGNGTRAEVKELATLKARIDAVAAICSKEGKDAPQENGNKK